MHQTTEQLIKIAQKRMKLSGDPIHDINHAERVAANTLSLSAADTHPSSSEEIEALTIAAWWHDVGRTVYQYPSFIFMIFLDDLLSGYLLWRETRRLRINTQASRLAKRLIFCHSFGTGKLLTRLLLRPHERHLLFILIDADRLDMIHTSRMKQICALAAQKRRYHRAYRFLTWYNLITNKHITSKSKSAHIFFITALADFETWFNSPEIRAWHQKKYGTKWLEKTVAALNLRSIRLSAKK